MINIESVVKTFKKKGKDIGKTAIALGCTGKVVRDYLTEAGYDFREAILSRKKETEEKRMRILESVEKLGNNLSSIKEDTGYSENIIIYHTKKLGLKVGKPFGFKENKKYICSLYKRSKGNAGEASRIYGKEKDSEISDATIRNYWIAAGFKMGKRGGDRRGKQLIS